MQSEFHAQEAHGLTALLLIAKDGLAFLIPVQLANRGPGLITNSSASFVESRAGWLREKTVKQLGESSMPRIYL